MDRVAWITKIADRFTVQTVVGLLGPRQCGKTTLARAYAELHPEIPVTRFDLEDPLDLAALSNPRLALHPTLTPPSNTPLGKPRGAKHSAILPKLVCI